MLELKIPPPLYLLIFGVLMSWLDYFFPEPQWQGMYNLALGGMFVLLGLVCIFWAAGLFFRAKTTVSPLTPSNSTQLVISGLYRFTRNPMYLGLLFMLIGWALYLGSLASALIVPAWVWALNRWQIGPEEKALEQRFGDDYRAYKNKVRRWL